MAESSVRLRAGNPFDFENGELELLAVELVRSTRVAVVVDHHGERGYGVSPWEVVEIIGAGGSALAAVKLTVEIFETTVEWCRARWFADRNESEDSTPRPRRVRVIYGPDGTVLRSVSIDLPDGEAIDD